MAQCIMSLCCFYTLSPPVDVVSAASLRLQRNIKLYMLDVLTLCYLQQTVLYAHAGPRGKNMLRAIRTL